MGTKVKTQTCENAGYVCILGIALLNMVFAN